MGKEPLRRLYEPYPEAVDVAGRRYPVLTDFRDWVMFSDLLKDPEITNRERLRTMLKYYRADIPLSGGDAVIGLCSFFLMKSMEEAKRILLPDSTGQEPVRRRKAPVMDYHIDADCITAGFLQAYGIDLETDALHWWKFQDLLWNLPQESEFRRRIRYRSMNPMEIKDQKERSRIIRIQSELAIPTNLPTVEEIGELLW